MVHFQADLRGRVRHTSVPVDFGPYYRPDEAKATAAMRPSPTLNAALDLLPS